MKKIKISLAYLILLTLLIFFQGCGKIEFFTKDLHKFDDGGGTGGNGDSYDGKLTFLYFTDDFTCNGHRTPKSILRRDLNKNWSYTNYEKIEDGSCISSAQMVSNVTYTERTNIAYYNNQSFVLSITGPTTPIKITLGPVPNDFYKNIPLVHLNETPDPKIAGYEIEIWSETTNSALRQFEVSIPSVSGDLTLGYAEINNFLARGHTYHLNIKAFDYAGRYSKPLISNPWTTLICPQNYVLVPESKTYSLNAFCIASYEMRLYHNGSFILDGNTNNAFDFDSDYDDVEKRMFYLPISAPIGQPWSNIKRGDIGGANPNQGALQACRLLGDEYDLVDNKEWQTIARNVENNKNNWFQGPTATALTMFRGHSDANPDFSLTISYPNNLYDQTGNSISDNWLGGSEQRRVHYLTNSSALWDLSGNVWEWTKSESNNTFGADTYIQQITDIINPFYGIVSNFAANAKTHFGPVSDLTTYDSSGGVGLGFGWLSTNNGTIMRGGAFNSNDTAGVFAVDISRSNNYLNVNVGFRCVYH